MKRRILIIAAAAVALLVVLVLAVVVGGLIYIDSSSGRAWLAQTIEDAASDPGVMEVEIGAIAPGLPGTIAIDQVVVLDGEGPWLTLEDVAVAWDPWALLTRNLTVDSFKVGEVVVSRSPAAAGTEKDVSSDDDSAAIPDLPVGVTIDEIAVARVDLDEALFGVAATLKVEGMASASRAGEVALDLGVFRTDGVGGAVQTKADVDLAANRLSLWANVYEPAGGVIVHMLELDNAPAFDLTLEGDGPASDWLGTLTANAGDDVAVDVGLRVQAGDALSVALDGDATLTPLVPADLQPLVGAPVAIDTAVVIDGDLYRIERLIVDARALAVSATGEADLAANTIDVSATLESRDNEPIQALADPLTLGTWQLSVTAIGDLATPELTVAGSVDALDVPDAVAGDVTLTARLTPDGAQGWQGEGQIVVDSLVAGEPALGALLEEKAHIDIAVGIDGGFAELSVATLQVTGGNLNVAAEGVIDLNDLSGEVDADIDVADLSGFSDMAGLPLSGGLTVQSNLTLAPDLSLITGPVAIDGVGLEIAMNSVSPFIGDSLAVTTELESDLATYAVLDALTATTESVDVAGRIDLVEGFAVLDGNLAGDLTVTPAVAGMLGADAGGSAAFQALLSGSVDDPVIRAEAVLNGVSMAGISADGVTAAAEVGDLSGAPSGKALITMPPQSGSLKIALSFVEEGEDINLPVIALNGPGLVGNGSLRVDGAGVVSGLIQASDADVGPLAGLAGMDGDGALSFRIDAQVGANGGQDAQIALSASDLTLALQDGGLMTLGDIRVDAALSDLDGAPGGTADISLSQAAFDAYMLDGAVVRVELAGDLATVDAQASGNAGVPVSIDTAFQADLASDELELLFDRLSGQVSEQDFAQNGPLRLRLGDGTVVVENIVLEMGGGTVAGDIVRTPRSLEAGLEITNLPFELIRVVAPRSRATGLIEGTAQMTTRDNAVVGSVALAVNDLDFSERTGEETMVADIRFNAELAENQITADLDVSGLPGSQLSGEARIGAALNASTLEATNAMSAPLDAAIDVNIKLAEIWETLPASDQRMTGNLVAALTAQGVVGDPDVAGELTLRDGTYEHLVYGTLIDQIALTVTGDSTESLNIALQARDGGDGRIEANGDINLAGEVDIQAALSLSSATLVRRDDVMATASGNITYSGTPLRGAIEGAITTDQIEINLVNSLPPSVVVLDVQDVYGGRGNGASAGGSSLWLADLDVTIDIPRRFFVRGRGVETEWFGNIAIAGTTDAPVVNGKIEVQRGQVLLVGRPFEITRGVVELDPEQIDNPILDVAAQSSREEVTGIITISGRALDPDIEITSNPPLPQAEVLPRVLFGKSSSNLSAFEAFEVASAVAELSGVTGGSGILDKTRQTLGIDVLRVSSDDEGDTRVGAGSYVTEDVYVGVEQGTQTGSGAVTVEVELTDSLSVETSTGTDASANVGVNWRWDY